MNIIKNIKKNITILIIITIVILLIVLKDDFNNIILTLKNIDLKYILLAIILYFLSIGIKGFVNYLIVNDKNKISIWEAIKHNIIIQFFNGITPFSTGGQPMEVYLLTEHKISLSKSTDYTVQSFIFYQIALVICGIIAVIYNTIFHLFPKVKLLQSLVLLGFIINILVIVFLLLISRSRRVMKVFSKITYKVCKKLKINKNEEEIENIFKEYYKGFKELKKRKGLATIGIILNMISLMCLYITPLIIILGIGNGNSMSIIDTLTASAYVYVVGSFVPIPGATGGIEYSFTQFYGNFIEIETISALLLVWRFITYYVGVIIGGLVFYIEKRVQDENRNIY